MGASSGGTTNGASPGCSLYRILPPPALAGSYGSLARFTNLRRVRRVGDYTLLGGSGEYSDFQHIMDLLSEVV